MAQARQREDSHEKPGCLPYGVTRKSSPTRNASTVCVKWLLPALLGGGVGSQSLAGNGNSDEHLGGCGNHHVWTVDVIKNGDALHPRFLLRNKFKLRDNK